MHGLLDLQILKLFLEKKIEIINNVKEESLSGVICISVKPEFMPWIMNVSCILTFKTITNSGILSNLNHIIILDNLDEQL